MSAETKRMASDLKNAVANAKAVYKFLDDRCPHCPLANCVETLSSIAQNPQMPNVAAAKTLREVREILDG